MRRRRLFLLLPVVLAAAPAGCFLFGSEPEERPYTWEWYEVRPPFDHAFIKRIAVLEFSNSTPRKGAGKIVADRIEQLLIEKSKYQVVSSFELARLVRGKRLNLTGTVDARTAQEVGRLAGVDALVVGNVETYGVKLVTWKEATGERTAKGEPVYRLCHKQTAEVTITFKVIDTRTGRIVWSKTSHGDWWRKGTRDHVAALSDFEYLQRATEEVLDDVWQLFPHKRRRKVFLEPPAGSD